ncbi:Protein of unknown function [Pseudomonas syringae]|nr:Protein of unknown function [Pseudomonas syringae]SFL69119.1 Protein of unknown function [Pseudomonas syringae]
MRDAPLRRVLRIGRRASRTACDAERRTIVTLQLRHLSFRTLQRGNALHDAPRLRPASRRVFRIGRRASRTACDAERRTIVTLQLRHLSFRTLQRGNALRDAPRHKSAPRRVFRIGRRASRTACDAERRTMVTLQLRHLSFRTLQRGNALGDAPRHKSASRRVFRIGRRASRTACDAERRTIRFSSDTIVPHAPAWECLA